MNQSVDNQEHRAESTQSVDGKASKRALVNSPMSSHLLEEASKIIPNTAVLVNLVSKRVRQLTNGQKPMVEVGPRMSNADIALQEIIEGCLTFEYLTEDTSAG
jgi:DNA-directed RNA polymerase subunit omega